MPRQGNGKKAAAQQWGKMKALEAATTEGKYILARVEKAIGFCQFQAKAEMPDGSVRDVTVLVRGKFKGGKNCATHVEAGCFVLVQGDIGRTLEIVGVVNRQSEMNKLRQSGRMSKKLMGDDQDLDDLFDHSEEEAALGPEGKAQKEEGNDLVSRYRRRAEAGQKLRSEIDMVRGLKQEDEEDVDSESEEVSGEARSGEARRPRRRKAAPAAPTQEAAEEEARRRAELAAELAEAKRLDELLNRKVQKSWEDDDELDIDAI